MENLFRTFLTLFALMLANTVHAGTSDSGGANGAGKKVYESYIRQPFMLPAFQKHLAPLFANIGKSDPGHQGEPLSEAMYATLKPWYFAPVDLKTIDNEALGITFIETKSVQIALQTSAEIWFDNRITNPDDDSIDTADAILHEIVMSMYLMKFVSYADLCRQTEAFSVNGCGAHASLIDKTTPAEDPRKLGKKDYENIRFITNWIKTMATEPIERARFIRALRSRGFDKRYLILTTAEEKSNPKPLKFTDQEFIQLLKGSELTGQLPDHCEALTSGRSSSCRMHFESFSIKMNTLSTPGLRIRVTVDNQPEIVIEHIMGNEITIFPQRDSEHGRYFMMSVGEFKAKAHYGERTYTGYLKFRAPADESSRDLDLEAVLLKPGIIVSVDKDAPMVCRAKRPRVVNFIDDAIAIREKSLPLTLSDRWLATMDPVVACAKDAQD